METFPFQILKFKSDIFPFYYADNRPGSCQGFRFPNPSLPESQSIYVLGFRDTPSVLIMKFLAEIHFNHNNPNENKSCKLVYLIFVSPFIYLILSLYNQYVQQREKKNSNIFLISTWRVLTTATASWVSSGTRWDSPPSIKHFVKLHYWDHLLVIDGDS